MQKKSLTFLLIMTLSLLVMNVFFKPSKKLTPQKTTEQHVVAKKSIESSVALQAGLPLVDIYQDSAGKNYLTTGVNINDHVVTIHWDQKLPQEVYFKKSHSSFPLQAAKLADAKTSPTEPVIYQANDINHRMPVAQLPSKGTFEVQLVEMQPYKTNPKIYTSFYSDGQLNSIGTLDRNAMVIAKTKDGFRPVGVYLGQEAKLIPLQDFSNLKSHLNVHKATFESSTHEKFYVLENDYQQLVFSNIGGALAEINLPIKSDLNSKSYVFKTAQDQKFLEQGSQHSMFPAHPFNKASKGTEASKGGYYPLLRRSVDIQKTQPRYYAFNIVSDYPGISELEYKVVHFDNHKIVFQADQNYRKIVKTFTLNNDVPYGLEVDIQVNGDHKDLWVTSGVPESEQSSNTQPSLRYQQTKNNKLDTVSQRLPKSTTLLEGVTPNWTSNSNGFFTLLVDPQIKDPAGYKVNKVPADLLGSRNDSIGTKSKKPAGYESMLPLGAHAHFKVYAGPMDGALLKLAGEHSPTNYSGAQSYQGFMNFISEPCAKILFSLMNAIQKVVGSWGLSIILLTFVLRILLYPLNAWSFKAMRKTQEIAPEISAIQKKYKANPKQAQVEVMALYRKRKVNPITGCLPMLIQMPFLIGMFSLLKSAFVLRGVPFVKGWIPDLTAPDVLFSWSHSIPFFGNEFHLLPLISCVMIWLQQKMSAVTPSDKSLITDQQKQQKMMSYMMVVFITLLCYSLPSGLNLYFIFSTFLGIVQQVVTNRLLDKKKKAPKILVNKKTELKEKSV